jgi:hypothetical protein
MPIGAFNPYGNSYSNNYLPGFASTSMAMKALVSYSDQAYPTFSPVTDVVTLSGGSGSSSTAKELNRMRDLNRRMQVAQALPGGSSVDPLSMSSRDFDQYIQQQVAMLNALKQANKTSPTKPAGDKTDSPLSVKAHDRYNSSGERVPVTKVTVHEAGNYSSRETSWNTGGYNRADATYGRAKKGDYYTVTVTWADGQQQQQQYKNDGYPVSIY